MCGEPRGPSYPQKLCKAHPHELELSGGGSPQSLAFFFLISSLNIYRLRQVCALQRWSDGDVDLTDCWLFVCQQKAIWRGEECGRVQSDLLLVWSGGESGVLEKINNVAPPGEHSLWYHIPSESRSFPLFIGPIRLTCAPPLPPPCNIEEGAEEQREKYSQQPPSESTVTFYSLHVAIASSSDVKI